MSALFDTSCYFLTKLFCSMVGLWPYQAQNQKRIIQSFSVFMVLSFVPPQLNRLHQVWGNDLDAVCMCMPPIFAIFISASKASTLKFFESEMKILLWQIEMEWKRTLTGGRNKILEFYASKSRTFCVAYTIALFGGLVCYILTPTISPILDIVSPLNETRARNLGFDLDYGIDMQTYWFWLWLHTSVTGVVVIINYIASDLMFITFSIHTCYMFAIVKYKLEHIDDSITRCNEQSIENQNVRQCKEQRLALSKQVVLIRECVMTHKQAIKCAQLTNCIYTNCLFVVVGFIVLTLSITAVQLVSKMFRWIEMMMSGTYLLCTTIHFLFLSLIAQTVMDESLKIHESAYSSGWYNMSPIVQRNIVLILLRSHSPCQLKAGKLFAMSMERFCAILQTSMSYFTMLVSFR